jgi:hypothetical protein
MRTSRHGWTRKPQPEHIIRATLALLIIVLAIAAATVLLAG